MNRNSDYTLDIHKFKKMFKNVMSADEYKCDLEKNKQADLAQACHLLLTNGHGNYCEQVETTLGRMCTIEIVERWKYNECDEIYTTDPLYKQSSQNVYTVNNVEYKPQAEGVEGGQKLTMDSVLDETFKDGNVENGYRDIDKCSNNDYPSKKSFHH